MNIKTIDVHAKEWLDRTYGNSYFAAKIIINYGLPGQREFTLPFQYGYGDHYIDMAKDELIKAGIISCDPLTALWRYCRENNILLRTNKKENCLKRELKYV